MNTQQHKTHAKMACTAKRRAAMMRCVSYQFAIALILWTNGKRDFVFRQGEGYA